MNRQTISIASAVALILLIHGNFATAQGASSATIYRLDQRSAYERGCFPPCYCALFATAVQGTFVLTPAGSNGLFQTYTVNDVNWIILQGKQQLLVTGSGSYENGGEVAAQQRLQLDLQVGNQPVQHFDSGLVIGGAAFPALSVTISVNGMHCLDTAFRVSASPVPTAAIHPYRLMSGSGLWRGCLPPCACLLAWRESLSGGFGLVELTPTPGSKQFAVVGADWTASPVDGGARTSMHGFGFYQVSGGRFSGKQRLILELAEGNAALTLFDSGLVGSGATFPLIAAKASSSGTRCIGTVITVDAAP